MCVCMFALKTNLCLKFYLLEATVAVLMMVIFEVCMQNQYVPHSSRAKHTERLKTLPGRWFFWMIKGKIGRKNEKNISFHRSVELQLDFKWLAMIFFHFHFSNFFFKCTLCIGKKQKIVFSSYKLNFWRNIIWMKKIKLLQFFPLFHFQHRLLLWANDR